MGFYAVHPPASGPSPYRSIPAPSKRPGTGSSAASSSRPGTSRSGQSSSQTSAGAGSAPSPYSRPVSAPHARPTPAGVNPHRATGMKSQPQSSVGKGGLDQAADGGGGTGVRFQQLYKLQGTLLRNLEGHKSASGPDGANSALQVWQGTISRGMINRLTFKEDVSTHTICFETLNLNPNALPVRRVL